VLETAITAQAITVKKQGREILSGITCQINAGTLTGLIGPSGSGKTTLMRSIIGAQRLSGGSLQVAGLKAGSKQLRKQIGYVTQSPAIYHDLTVLQNLHYFGAIVGASKRKVTEVLEQVDLQSVARQLGSTLSGGQQARVSLAIALLGDAPVLVLDEPTVGLDPLLRRDLCGLFTQLAAQGRTLLVSSHVMDEAERCDRLLLLRSGKVLFSGAKNDLLVHTATHSVEDAFLVLIAAATTSAGSQKGQN